MKQVYLLFPITLMALSACSSGSSSPVAMPTSLTQSNSPKILFSEWMGSKAGAKKEETDYGIQYSFTIPYYEDTFLGDERFKYPYKKEFDAVDDGVRSLCKKLDLEYFTATQNQNDPTAFVEFDPAESLIHETFYPGCVNRTGKNFFVVTDTYSQELNKFYVTLFTDDDNRESLRNRVEAEKNSHHNALVENQNIDLENQKIKSQRDQLTIQFQKGIKVGMDSEEGLIIDVKKPLVQVQTQKGLIWKKISDVHPQGLPDFIEHVQP